MTLVTRLSLLKWYNFHRLTCKLRPWIRRDITVHGNLKRQYKYITRKCLHCLCKHHLAIKTRETWESCYDDVIKWKHFPLYWPFVRGIHRYPVNSPHKGQWRGALMFCLICAWINGWVNNGETVDLTRHRAHYDVTLEWQDDYNLRQQWGISRQFV